MSQQYKLIKREWFSLSSAEVECEYALYYLGRNMFGRAKWKPVKNYHPIEFPIPYTGDLKWARKVAKHYGIEMP